MTEGEESNIKYKRKAPWRPKWSKVRPPVPGFLCSGSGSTSPSPGLKCPFLGRWLALAPERGVKVQGKAAGSVQSPHSNVRWGQGLEGVWAGWWGAGGARDGPRF